MFIHTIHYSFYHLKQFLILHLVLFLDFISVLSRLNVTGCDTDWGDNSNTLVTVRCYKFITKRLSYWLVIDYASLYAPLCQQLRAVHVMFVLRDVLLLRDFDALSNVCLWRCWWCHVRRLMWRPIRHLSDIFIKRWRWCIVICVCLRRLMWRHVYVSCLSCLWYLYLSHIQKYPDDDVKSMLWCWCWQCEPFCPVKMSAWGPAAPGSGNKQTLGSRHGNRAQWIADWLATPREFRASSTRSKRDPSRAVRQLWAAQ